jgi:hypothetical protein
MNNIPHDDRADKTHKPVEADGPGFDPKDLTCNEAQVEDLLSEGESTEDEADDEDQA